ncbi:hypothetical protein GCK32_012088 [Trichostrongylus colubriformis]|uniref:Adenylate kinase n=1 Tax=Trichostrongylus colubriformis TaxID=6319 RepID=A0AAN8IJ24_TRICO
MAPAQKLYNVVSVLGPPGSGEGTQCVKIHENLGFMHLSAGDLLRAERQRQGSQLAMDAAGDARGFLVDGFPRNQDNLERWEQQMKKKVSSYRCMAIAVINFLLLFLFPSFLIVS